MNKRELNVKRLETWKSFHTPGMPNYAKRTKNAVFISPANSLIHEQKKLEICWNLRKEKKQFITEAVPNKVPNRQVDIVCLDTGEWIEVEVTGKVKPDANVTYVYKHVGGASKLASDEWEVVYK